MNEIEQFINNFKGEYGSVLEEVFTRYNCYWFAKILNEQFGTEILFSPDESHFLSIDGDNQLYDIRGNITDQYDLESLYPWDDYYDFDEEDYNRITDYCIDLRRGNIEE